VALSGAATTAQLATNLRAARHALTCEQVARLTAAVAESPEHYWRTRAALAWT
jgi:aryl-alcohol dehydrogenase-like predicted oxidoreductase